MNTIGFQGANGAYAEDAILELTSTHPSFTSHTFKTEGFDTMTELFHHVQRGTVRHGLIPIENSLSGTLHSVLELFTQQEPRLWVVGEYQISESHYIMARPGTALEDITEVLSHPAILEQCQDFLDNTLPEGYRAVLSSNTATAAEQVATSDERGLAALAGKRAAELHNLTILGSDSTPTNVTRYWLISRYPVLQPDRNQSPKSSFALVMKNQVGALHRVCSCFALRDINITKLESRPSSRTITLASPWEYVTYIDIEGAPGNEDNVKRAVENLQEFTQKCIHLGSYPRYLPGARR
ncbi:prephenate dehydratase [Entomortierella parvispora]|uniref:prephenate dehydratase n=1 Tax=Entomortierella parvispora TaxID=205924 RepID=A0A9P3HCM5_9FUNG|nr:prephenate dehydratase [Entomortierella parvispora]